MSCTTFQVVGLLMLLAGDVSQSANPSYYVRQATWHGTLRASREALMESEAGGEAGSAPLLGPWYCSGPFAPNDRQSAAAIRSSNQAFDPERDDAASSEGARLPWTMRLDLKPDAIHSLYRDQDEHVVYLYRHVVADKPTRFPIYLDALGRLSVWYNGQQTLAVDGNIAYNLWNPDVQLKPRMVELALRAGTNHLVVKIASKPRPQPAEPDPWRQFTASARRPWGSVFNGYETRTGPATDYESLVQGEVSQFYFSTSPTPDADLRPPVLARRSLWRLLRRDFDTASDLRQMDRERRDGIWRLDWSAGDLRQLGRRYAGAIGDAPLRLQATELVGKIRDESGLAKVRQLYHRFHDTRPGSQCLLDEESRRKLAHKIKSLRLAITDLIATFPHQYSEGVAFQSRLDTIQEMVAQASQKQEASLYAQACADLDQLRYDALLANPLLDFNRLLLIRRRASPLLTGLPMNWANNSSLPQTGYDNQIAILAPVGPRGELATVYRPPRQRFVGDMDLHFDGQRLLFSMPDDQNRWQVFEVHIDGQGLRQVTPGDQDAVDSFDACYLPNGQIIFCSTAVFAGVPCVRGRDYVAVLYVMDQDGENIRQLCFEQDQDWCPTLLNDGRVLYTRWEYTDIPHFFSRLLFSMNPDGTDQKEYYGSNSYWPNAIFFARPIPNHPTQVVGIVSGHHVARRSGELVLFDPAKGRHEVQGVVQRIPGHGETVEPVINDRLVVGSWPKFLHPYPLSDKYFLVSCQMDRESRWGIYLVDVFDNLLPLSVEEDYDLLEPIPLRERPRPPVIPARIDTTRKDALVNLADIYAGPGLAGVPRGTVKKLRLIAYHYAYRDMAEDSQAIGVDSSWDTVKIVLGTVPVCRDGSALFRVPANTPISLQPLDAEGKALQLMRSWMTAMPGETLSCVGCHASSNTAPAVRSSLAMKRGPLDIEPWYGPPRGFSFRREVQPVLDRYCVGCHNQAARADGRQIIDLREAKSSDPRGFSPSYLQLHRFVRRPGAETDYHLLAAAEYHADGTELIQLLQKGHYGVQLDAEAWDRLITWIDLNVPFHGTWSEAQGESLVGDQRERRRRLRRLYAGVDEDPEVVHAASPQPVKPIVPHIESRPREDAVDCPGWPLDASQARKRQQAEGERTTRTLHLGNDVTLQLVRIPAGEFVMGDATGYADERPRRVRIKQPFWMGKFEVTNEQFARFDPSHDSRYIRTHGISSTRGYPVNLPRQPVVRVSWLRATAFCRWLSEKTGQDVRLPTEAMWEYACRAGTATPLSYGDLDTDFSRDANLADQMVEHLRDYSHNSQLAWMPRDARFRDGAMVTAPVGSYRPNVWGLHDMHGNASEWTRSSYSPSCRSCKDTGSDQPMVVRGGSWRDRPLRSRSAFRLAYPKWQKVYNVGFRVVAESKRPKADQTK